MKGYLANRKNRDNPSPCLQFCSSWLFWGSSKDQVKDKMSIVESEKQGKVTVRMGAPCLKLLDKLFPLVLLPQHQGMLKEERHEERREI